MAGPWPGGSQARGFSLQAKLAYCHVDVALLATSGTTAKPKLSPHKHGGYQVHIHSMGSWMFGLNENDVWWSTSDIGWIVGHSYMVYAPLLVGCTTIAFEGALDYPQPGANWRTAVEEFGVTGIFTSPTAVRLLMRYGNEPLRSIDHSRLERVVSAGEVLNRRRGTGCRTRFSADECR